MLVAVCTKLLQKTPIKYPLVILLTCLDPGNVPEQCRIMMKLFLASCVELKHVSETDGDDILMQFMDFIHQTPMSELDNFKKRMISLINSFRELWQAFTQGLDCIVEFALLISHGQASVQRGLSLHQQRNDCGESRSNKFDGWKTYQGMGYQCELEKWY